MSSELIDSYDAQTVADTFLRYIQNTRLLDLLARYIGNKPDERYLDIGFSGRLSLFACLAPNVSVINLSSTQLSLGIKLIDILIDYYNKIPSNWQSSEDLPLLDVWGSLLQLDELKGIRLRLHEQITAIKAVGKIPKRPVQTRTYHTTFKYQSEGLEASSFDSLTMVDVLIHIEDLDNVFREIERVLVPGGFALITFYPPSSDYLRLHPSKSHYKCLDQIFVELTAANEVPFETVCSSNLHTLFPSAFHRILAERSQIIEQSMVRRYWLDLPNLQLHSEKAVLDTAKVNGLLPVKIEAVPGGMFEAYREVLILSK